MQPIKATIIIPTYDHGPLLSYAVNCARQQTISNIEIFIVGDCVPDNTRALAASLTQEDPRIRFFDNREKDPRVGELYRNQALTEAQGEIICYLSDDDLWLPNHVASMYELLKHAEFANSIPVIIQPHGLIQVSPVDLAQPYFRQHILTNNNRIPLTFAAHTLEAYKQLPNGWQTTPKNSYSDHHMWKQFLQHSHFRATSGNSVTAINFPSATRKQWTVEKRLEELAFWQRELQNPQGLEQIKQRIFESCWRLMTWYEACYEGKINQLQTQHEASYEGKINLLQTQLDNMTNSQDWKIYKKLMAIPLLPRLIRAGYKISAKCKHALSYK